MKNKLRFMALLIVAVLCMTAFTVPAFAESGDYPDEQPEESHVEDTADNTQTVTVNVAANDDGSRTVTIGDQSWTLADGPEKTGKVVNVRSYLNLRTGPGTDYSIIGHLLNGMEVEVVGENNGWYEIIVPEKRGYVCGKYLEVLAAQMGSTEDMDKLLKILLQYYAAQGTASAPLTPDGNLTLVDDIGSVRGAGKQFITVESKAGKELPNFLTPENYLKNAEMAMEDDYGMIDGIVNNGPKKTAAEIEADAMSGKPVSLLSYVEAVRREQQEQKEAPKPEKKPSVLAKLQAPVSEPKKTARSKSAETTLSRQTRELRSSATSSSCKSVTDPSRSSPIGYTSVRMRTTSPSTAISWIIPKWCWDVRPRRVRSTANRISPLSRMKVLTSEHSSAMPYGISEALIRRRSCLIWAKMKRLQIPSPQTRM